MTYRVCVCVFEAVTKIQALFPTPSKYAKLKMTPRGGVAAGCYGAIRRNTNLEALCCAFLPHTRFRPLPTASYIDV